ncbi:hypothetical protein K488DRAFT_84301 [Vararia minispora EC-137]|uniref:Uncharacterized protein n=1 Tax=Vararia minispora EC-137 TaxID=1314806 RepID=A0ACB8QR99_9AGAM|nr:hypothetical protein K488DRAFT_84301 [Vararia minispora EC-137]
MSEYACKCLNVRVRSQPATAAPPRSADQFLPIFVSENGVSVVHNQLTVRVRSRAKPISTQADELQRYVSLLCLACGTTVYRVSQIIPPDMDAPEGPVLPTDDWVEDTSFVLFPVEGILPYTWRYAMLHEFALRISGLPIDGPRIKEAERSSAYSSFRIIITSVPSRTEPPLTPVSPFATESPALPPLSHSPPEEPSRPYRALPFLQPIFPPAPFTSSHPVFVHLSSVASQRSHAIRHAADDFLSRLIAEKVAEVMREETELRGQVEALWSTFRAALADAEAAGGPPAFTANEAVSPPIREREDKFTPPGRAGPPVSPSSRSYSALSTSLSASAFQQQRASASAPVPRSNSESSSSSPPPGDETPAVLRRSLRRDLSEDKDVATSFKYTLDIASEMERRAAERGVSSKDSPTDNLVESSAPPVLSPKSKQATARSPPPRRGKTDSIKEPEKEASPSKAKAKRKVTFDLQTPEKEKSAVNGHASANDAVIFDLEDETDSIRLEPFAVSPTLPLNEAPQPHVPHRPPNKRNGSQETGLPQSLSLLRPTSLPKPSPLRLSTSPPSRTSSNSTPLSLTPRLNGSPNGGLEPLEPLTPREEALSRLVAADVPSHRTAWRKDGKAWSVFSGRNTIQEVDEEVYDTRDENEDKASPLLGPGIVSKEVPKTAGVHWRPPVVASLPVFIGPNHTRTASGGFTYQPKTSLSDMYGQMVPVLRDPGSKNPSYASSAALRKAAYAERDLARSMDPGALDFLMHEDEDEDEDGELSADAGSRGRRNALRILKARSELPSEGMWRSLAT